ncbi:MAG: aminopeptidase [Ignavibacteriae bacterium]|nr:aminopeptidase [Ignavibacteriota bacterium]
MNIGTTDVMVDEDLIEGAYNAVNVCLRVKPHEKVTVITDERTHDIADAICSEVAKVGARCTKFLLEDFAPRPHTDMPQPILDDLATSQVSVYAAWGQTGELRTRMQMTRVVTDHRIRHGHMININRQIMTDGMRADFTKVDEISTRIWNLARIARTVVCKSPFGTNITADLSPKLKWLKTSGIISPDKWGNLPGGEIFTSPAKLNGTFIVDGVVGDYLCAKYGDLNDTPVSIEIKDSRMVSARCDNKELEREFWEYCHTDKNSDRVGEFAIGTNIQLKHVIGHILQDEKIPGVHIAFGHPYSEHTGADWSSSTHIDVVGTKFDIWIDGQKIMERGEFLI